VSDRARDGGSALGGLFGSVGRLVTRPVRGLAGSNGVDVPGRLEAAAVEAAATTATERAVDGILAGPLPERIGRSLGEHRVVERVVAETVASMDLERAVTSALESERTERLVEQVLASPALERLIGDVFESKVRVELTERILGSPEFERMLGDVLSSPQVRHALTQQSTGLAGEAADAARGRAVRLDDAVERPPRRWFRRAPRLAPAAEAGEAVPSTPYAGIATRATALAVDAGVLAVVYVTISAFVALIGSLVGGHLHPAWLAGTIAGAGWLLLLVVYFVTLWATVGQTLGMRLMRLRVRDHRDAAPGVARSIVRFVGLLLAIVPCFAGFLPVLVDDRRRALQDFLAGTVVVHEEPEPVA
jgi:uncharacterized RDD family membrane protein YckC